MSEYDALLRVADKLANAATPGPWLVQDKERCGNCGSRHIVEERVEAELGEYGTVYGEWHPEVVGCWLDASKDADDMVRAKDAAFIARSRTLVPELAAALRASEARAEAAEKRERAYREALKEALVVNGWPLCRIDGCEYPPTFYSVEYGWCHNVYPSGVCPEHAPDAKGGERDDPPN